MAPRHIARLTPFGPETSWSVEGGELVQRRGDREMRHPLGDLRRIRRSPRGAVLVFPRSRVTIPALSFGDGLRPQVRFDSFEALMSALSAGTPQGVRAPGPPAAGSLLWIMALLAGGAAALLVFATMAGAWELGLALAARLLFVLILAAAVLPWLDRPRA